MAEGLILVNCGNACNQVIKKAKSDIRGVTSAVKVEKNSPTSPDVMINILIKSRDDIIKAKDKILDIDGVKSIRYLITK